MNYERELGTAIRLARAGGRIAMGHFLKTVRTERKVDGTWVTEADWAVEARIRLEIARDWPDHNVLGEEEGLTAAGGGPARPGAPTWIVDPIDGTNNFIAGIPIWATLVGLSVDDAPVVGVCHAPALGETYDAAAGAGARLNDRPIEVDPEPNLADATVVLADFKEVLADASGFWSDLAAAAWRTRGFGDFWGHMLVARGSAHVMVEANLSVWDVAALQPIVNEAGGRMTRLDGSPWTHDTACLTTNGALHEEITQMARSHGVK